MGASKNKQLHYLVASGRVTWTENKNGEPAFSFLAPTRREGGLRRGANLLFFIVYAPLDKATKS
jgi:hypothetical protein